MSGDVKMVFKLSNFSFHNSTLFRIMLNTAFIQRGNYIKAGKMELSPEKLRRSNNLPDNFIVYIFFEDFCLQCNPQETEVQDLCDKCKHQMGEEVVKEWIYLRN